MYYNNNNNQLITHDKGRTPIEQDKDIYSYMRWNGIIVGLVIILENGLWTVTVSKCTVDNQYVGVFCILQPTCGDGGGLLSSRRLMMKIYSCIIIILC